MKSKLKAPVTERLKLKYDNLLSRFGFKRNLRRHAGAGIALFSNAMQAGA
jgi:hypothetical protein